MASTMTSVATPFKALAAALIAATARMGNKQTLVRYLQNYYHEINTDGDMLVNEMIYAFKDCQTPYAFMFEIEHPDTELVELCARHIVEDALMPQKLTAWLACQRPRDPHHDISQT